MVVPNYGNYGENLRSRTLEFACAMVRYCDRLLDGGGGSGRVLAPQLLRCGTSIGANLEEARAAESRRDFISKCSVALKEARESVFRLRIAERCGLGPRDTVAALSKDAGEIAAILGAIIRNARNRESL
jgi:four helix bundle protein